MPHVVLLGVLIINKLGVLFVQRKVCQVSVFRIFTCRGVILVNCKSRQTFVINVNSPRIYACDHDIDA